MTLNRTEELIAEIAAGRMVVLMDDEDRENEGDLVMAATHVRPEDINFMASHGRGLICLTLTRERCEQLALPLMVRRNVSLHSTNFTLSIEAAIFEIEEEVSWTAVSSWRMSVEMFRLMS